ncbi:MAG: hypothetical protein WC767_03055 [Candidatus Paceibacterota bacterium]
MNNEKVPEKKGGDLAYLSVFNNNRHFAFVYKKTEKLVTALYMITNYIHDEEPLKWHIRERALELMSLNISFNTVSLSERKGLLKEYQAFSVEITSLASIAYHSGLISEMNWVVLKREFENLVETIERGENKHANEETIIINPSFFDATLPAPEAPRAIAESTGPASSSDVLYKGHAQSVAAPARNMSFMNRKPENKVKKDNPRPVAEKKEDRKDVILSVLSKKDGLSVKDFVDALKDVSEKTIQRELLAMVASGTIRKEGERRWSRYFMIKA